MNENIPTTSLSSNNAAFPSPTVSEEDERCDQELQELDNEIQAAESPKSLNLDEENVIPETEPEQDDEDNNNGQDQEGEIMDLDDSDGNGQDFNQINDNWNDTTFDDTNLLWGTSPIPDPVDVPKVHVNICMLKKYYQPILSGNVCIYLLYFVYFLIKLQNINIFTYYSTKST